MTTDTKSQIDPTLTPLFIGAGVEFVGTISHTGPTQERAVVLGDFVGDINWNGILQVPQGGKVTVKGALRCREMMIGGEIVGEGDDVLIETGLLRLGDSARIAVSTVSVPTGGLEQARGSIINATLRMTSDHPFAADPVSQPAQPLQTSNALRHVYQAQMASSTAHVPSSANVTPDTAADAMETTSSADDAGLVQIETRAHTELAA